MYGCVRPIFFGLVLRAAKGSVFGCAEVLKGVRNSVSLTLFCVPEELFWTVCNVTFLRYYFKVSFRDFKAVFVG